MNAGNRHQDSLQLYQNGKAIKAQLSSRLWLGWGLFGGGVLIFLSVVAIQSSKANWVKGAGLMTSIGMFAGGIAISYRDELTEKLAGQYDKASNARLSLTLNNDHEYAVDVLDMQNVQDKIELIELMPPEQRLYWYQRYNLLGLVQMSQQVIEPSNTGVATIRPKTAMTIAPGVCDTSWLTKEFAYRNKIVCGGGGDGKSNYLRWESGQIEPDH